MSERERLMDVLVADGWLGHADEMTDWHLGAIADAILASDWLASHDASIREEALKPVRALVERAERLNAPEAHRTDVGHEAARWVEKLRAVIDTPAQADGGEVG